jgi:putative SOS response-associated peptidase YedK
LVEGVNVRDSRVQDTKGGRKPINAKCETVHRTPMFRDAYARRRCIVPVDGFFEWKALKGQRVKQPYAIAMKDGSPFGLGGVWENWKIRIQASGCARSRSSPLTPTNWSARSTIACR